MKPHKKQKFKRGTMVRVSDRLPQMMSHFHSGFFGIVEYSYKQEYGYGSNKDYSLIVLNSKGEAISSICWYPEDCLTAVSTDYASGKEIIEKYHYG